MRKPAKFYKERYIIAFYDRDGEYIEEMFDNVRDILKYCNKEITNRNVNIIDIELYRALKRENHETWILGKLNRVYIIDIREEEE